MRRLPVLGVFLLLFAAGCAGPRAIGTVLSDPSQFANRDVRIEGDVVDSYAMLGRGAYRVRDNTGQLWIISDSVPRQGARVAVKGRIREGFNLGSLGDALPAGLGSGVVMMESSHRTR